MKKVLLTGGAGFIGSHVADDLAKLGHEIVVLDDLSGGFAENINPQALFIHGSVTNAELINKLFAEHRFTHVYHLAAYAAEGLSHFIRKFNYENNLIGSINLINAAVNFGVECFVFTSSIAVYGAGQTPMTEDMTPLPEDPYGISKLAVEQDLKAAHEMFGLNYVIFRPHNVYGERQNIGDKYRNVIGIFMNRIMQEQPLPIFGDGSQQRAFSYIGDISPIIAKAGFESSAYNETFNIGADTPYTVKDLAETIAKSFNVSANINFQPARNEVKIAFSDHDKVKKMLGYENLTDLRTGIQKMADWAKRHGPRQSKKFEGIEIEKNLPSSWVS